LDAGAGYLIAAKARTESAAARQQCNEAGGWVGWNGKQHDRPEWRCIRSFCGAITERVESVYCANNAEG